MSFAGFDILEDELNVASKDEGQTTGQSHALNLLTKLLSGGEAVQQGWAETDKLHAQIESGLKLFLEQIAYPEVDEAYRLFQDYFNITQQRQTLPLLANKKIIGIGGGFSAGKSRFLNSLLQAEVLPEALEPCTAIPSYLIAGTDFAYTALTRLQKNVALNADEVQLLAHDLNSDANAVQIPNNQLVQHLTIQVPSLPWQQLAFLDMPGYSKADLAENQQSDEQIAREQLQNADHIIWVLSAKNGGLKNDDLNFIESLAVHTPIFFLISQSDLVNRSELNQILAGIRTALQNRGISFAGITAWQVPLHQNLNLNLNLNLNQQQQQQQGKDALTHFQLLGDSLLEWLKSLDVAYLDEKLTKYHSLIQEHIQRMDQYIEIANQRNKADLGTLNECVLRSKDWPHELRQRLQAMIIDHRRKTKSFVRFVELFRTAITQLVTFLPANAEQNVAVRLNGLPLSAEQGSSEAQFQLGMLHESGNGAEQNDALAFICFLKAAKLGHAHAQFSLAQFYEYGRGVSQDYAQAISWYRKAAIQSFAPAQFSLGLMYQKGIGVNVAPHFRESQAVHWFQKAAEQGNVDVQYILGVMYQNGDGVQQDNVQAVSWYRKAAEQGDADAQCCLGAMHEKGDGVPQNHAQAVNWYRKAAEQGNAEGQCALAEAYVSGQGVSRDSTQAVNWYRKAAEQEHVYAQNILVDAYDKGNGVPRDYTQAAHWLRKAAEQGDAGAQYSLGARYEEGVGVPQDYVEAVSWYSKAAKQGDADAQYCLGLRYEEGYGVLQNNIQAVSWYRKAAEQGHVNAQFKLGSMYEEGYGVLQNTAKAVSWYHKAAEQGHVNAQFKLGSMYISGQGVAQNFRESAIWFRKAAEQGHADAQHNLGLIYEYGQGVSRDSNQALNWYRKAAAQGHAAARSNVFKIEQSGEQAAREQNEVNRRNKILKDAEQLSAAAICQLARNYRDVGGAADNKTALLLFKLAAKMGDHDARLNVEWMS